MKIMHRPRKRHSWPPSRDTETENKDGAMDEDPFAYFVSSMGEEEHFLESNLSAGIINRRRSRSLPDFRHKPLPGRSVVQRATSQATKFKRWIDRMEKQYFHRSSPEVFTPSPPSPPPDPLSAPSIKDRGRDIRSTATSRIRNSVRTPPRRPRAWREPSGDIWPVAEEGEEIGLGIIV